MNSTSESTAGGVLDWLKWLLITALIGGAIFGNWYFRDESLLYRVLGLVGVAVAALLVAVTTHQGSATWSLLKEARTEIRRVVWPSRQETNQTTMIVLALIIIFALILWGLDSGLSWVVASIIG